MMPLKLGIIGYLSYLSFILNDMDSFQSHMGEAVSILNGLLRREKYLETVVIWLNQFGFLLVYQFNQKDLLEFVDVLRLIIE
jgi:archaellum biogenesis ATPase FlaH